MTPTPRFDIIVLGGANTDFVVQGLALPAPGQTVPGDVFHQGPGGKGANQAVAAARLGARTAFIACLGSDPRGDELLAHIATEGVDVSHVIRDDQPTGAALISVDARGQKQITAYTGANARLTPADVHRLADLIRSARVLLTQLESPPDAIRAALTIARAAGVTTVLDPAPPRTDIDDLLPLVDIIRPNAHEAGVLTGVEVTDRPTAHAAAQRLLRRGPRAAFIGTPDGNLLVAAGHDDLFLPHLNVKSIDATGAGDACAAALAVMLADGQPLDRAARFAHAAAALATTRLGAQAGLPTRSDVEAML